MHWIERGPEPAKLKPIREHYTQPWIEFYLLHTLGEKPTDARWREFRVELTEEFTVFAHIARNSPAVK